MTRPCRIALSGLAAGLALTACSSGPTSLSAQVQSWSSSTGFLSGLQQLRSDLRGLSTLPADNAGERRTVCDVLVTDALNDNEQLPSPDSTLTSLLSRAYTKAATAGRDCYRSAASLPATQADAQEATSLLVAAEARYDGITSELPGSS